MYVVVLIILILENEKLIKPFTHEDKIKITLNW